MSAAADLPRRLADILGPTLGKLAGSEEARAYAAWARAVGEPVARGTHPKAFRRGQLTVECSSSVWAGELTYLGPQILRRMDEVAPGHPVKRFRFVVGRIATADRPPAGSAEEEPLQPPAEHVAAVGQESGPSAANGGSRDRRPAPDAGDPARAQVGGVRDERLRAAIEAALRRSSEEPSGAPGGGASSG